MTTAREPDWGVVGKLALLVAVMGLGLALSVGAAQAAPTKAQFIRQGDALCREVQRELAPLVRRAQVAKSLPASRQWAAAERLWADQIRVQARFTARLRAVGLPTGDSKARSIVLGLGRGLVLARRVRDAFARRKYDFLGCCAAGVHPLHGVAQPPRRGVRLQGLRPFLSAQ